MFHDKNYVFLELILPQLPVPLTTSAEESNDESRDANILVDTSSDELGKNLDSDDVVLTDDLLTEHDMETDESEETSASDVDRFV